MKAKASSTCYACDKPATTKEHAPPRSFFPQGHRTNLITVPSCPDHNTENSKDVEYTRNIITTMFGINSVGEKHFAEKTARSFSNSPKLLNATFGDLRSVNFRGVNTGAVTVDLKRVDRVMEACVCALHFRETGQKQSKWEIALPNFLFQNGVPSETVSLWKKVLTRLSQFPYTVRPTNAPDVFEYAIADIPGGRVYSMRFYKAFLVFAFVRPAGK